MKDDPESRLEQNLLLCKIIIVNNFGFRVFPDHGACVTDRQIGPIKRSQTCRNIKHRQTKRLTMEAKENSHMDSKHTDRPAHEQADTWRMLINKGRRRI